MKKETYLSFAAFPVEVVNPIRIEETSTPLNAMNDVSFTE